MQNLSVYKQLITKNHDFQKLFAARLITLGGDWLLTVPLLGIIYELTENPFITSLVLVVQSAPLFIFGSFGGYLADKYDRKIIISISEFVSGMVVVLILYAVNTENVPFILFSFSLLSVANSAYMPTSDAALPNVVSRENLAEANVLFFSSWGIMAGIGAGLGGFLTTVFSREVLFTVDFLSFFVSAILVFNIKKDLSEKNEVTNSIKQEVKFKDGINFVRNNNAIFYLIITKATFAISASALVTIYHSLV
jgi:MFS family permease